MREEINRGDVDPNSTGSPAVTLVGAQDPGCRAQKRPSTETGSPSPTQYTHFFNSNTLLTHKDRISHGSSAFWLLWETAAPAAVGGHSCF